MLFLLAKTIASMGGREGGNVRGAEEEFVVTGEVTAPPVRARWDENLAQGNEFYDRLAPSIDC
jgi:hypothetical protein